MAEAVHARNTEQGLRFRVWNSGSDSYRTEEMTEEELRKYLREDVIRTAIEKCLDDIRKIGDRVHRAATRGTSAVFGVPTTRDLDAPWNEERQ